MMRQSLPPAMNMDSVLEGRLKCRAARKGESRSAGSEETEWPRREALATVSEDLKADGLVNSGCLMTTHSYRWTSGCSWGEWQQSELLACGTSLGLHTPKPQPSPSLNCAMSESLSEGLRQ